jgi:hypothetical protein
LRSRRTARARSSGIGNVRVLVTVLVAPLTLPPETAIRDSSTRMVFASMSLSMSIARISPRRRPYTASSQAIANGSPAVASRTVTTGSPSRRMHLSLLRREALH